MEQQTQNLSSELDVRKAKIEQLEKNGEIVYKTKFDCSCKISEAREKLGEKVRIAGRIVFRRVMGKFGFMQIRNLESKIQVSVGRNELDEEAYDYYKKMIVGISPFVNDIRLFYNDIGKDYGVKKEEIKLKEIMI